MSLGPQSWGRGHRWSSCPTLSATLGTLDGRSPGACPALLPRGTGSQCRKHPGLGSRLSKSQGTPGWWWTQRVCSRRLERKWGAGREAGKAVGRGLALRERSRLPCRAPGSR